MAQAPICDLVIFFCPNSSRVHAPRGPSERGEPSSDAVRTAEALEPPSPLVTRTPPLLAFPGDHAWARLPFPRRGCGYVGQASLYAAPGASFLKRSKPKSTELRVAKIEIAFGNQTL